MLILYKPYDFRFSDLLYGDPNVYGGWFNDPDIGRCSIGDIEIQVRRISTSPSLYNLYFRSISREIAIDLFYGKTKAEVECYVYKIIKREKRINELVKLGRYANTI